MTKVDKGVHRCGWELASLKVEERQMGNARAFKCVLYKFLLTKLMDLANLNTSDDLKQTKMLL